MANENRTTQLGHAKTITGVDLFISYASEDFRHARRLYASLSGIEEVKVWLDKETLLPGDDWESDILSTIERSRFFVVLISTVWVEKDGFVKRELQKAVECLKAKDKRDFSVIPVRIEPCNFKHEVLGRLHYVDLFPDWDRGVADIRKAIRNRVETDMGVAFDLLREAWFEDASAEETWCKEYGDYVLRLSPTSVMQFLDKKHDKLEFELHAVDVLARLATRQRSSTLFDYVLRTFEIVRMSGYSYEWPQFYGIVLQCASLLTDKSRATFLRDVFNYFIDHLSGVYGGEWWGELALRDIVKHYLCCEKAIQVTGVDIRGRPFLGDADVEFRVLSKCLDVMTWDIPLIDLLVFLGRKNHDPHILHIAQALIYRTGYDVLTPLPDIGHHPLFSRIDQINLEVADHKQDISRFGLLLRIGEYLRNAFPDEGVLLKDKALERLRKEEPMIDDRVIDLLTGDRCSELFDAIERQDDEILRFYFEDGEQRKRVRQLVCEGPHARKTKDDDYLPVPLPVGIFTMEGEG